MSVNGEDSVSSAEKTAENEGTMSGDEKEKKINPQNKPASCEGTLMAGCHILSNRVLDEVLNEKKLALMRSPEVVRFLQERTTAKKSTTKLK